MPASAMARFACRVIPPNVYYAECPFEGATLRCKYAMLPLDQFAEWMTRRTSNPYFWAHFAQPSALIYAADAEVKALPLLIIAAVGLIANIVAMFVLLRDVVRVLTESTPRGTDVDEIRGHLLETPGVVAVHDVHVWAITSGQPVFTAHVECDADVFARGETGVMLVTVAATVATHNLAIGVGCGVVTAMILFARRVAHLVDVSSALSADGAMRTYTVTGELFFASDRELIDAFDYAGDPSHVVIDMSRAHLWDTSAVAALDAITMKYAAHGVRVDIVGMNAPSTRLHDAHSEQLVSPA
jgi:hypothetical protein